MVRKTMEVDVGREWVRYNKNLNLNLNVSGFIGQVKENELTKKTKKTY
jgi:hypothetical protein